MKGLRPVAERGSLGRAARRGRCEPRVSWGSSPNSSSSSGPLKAGGAPSWDEPGTVGAASLFHAIDGFKSDHVVELGGLVPRVRRRQIRVDVNFVTRRVLGPSPFRSVFKDRQLERRRSRTKDEPGGGLVSADARVDPAESRNRVLRRMNVRPTDLLGTRSVDRGDAVPAFRHFSQHIERPLVFLHRAALGPSGAEARPAGNHDHEAEGAESDRRDHGSLARTKRSTKPI